MNHLFCRIFDLSTDIGQPEQEYYLQPVEYGSSRNAAAICPVDFSFGGEHLWDKFSVRVLSFTWQSNMNIFVVFISMSDILFCCC